MKHVVLYGREGCCLCDDALELLEQIRARDPEAFALDYVDIESDPELLRRYLERIPVIAIDGREAFELVVDGSELERSLGIVRAR